MLNSEQKVVDPSKQNADFVTGACLGINGDPIDNFTEETFKNYSYGRITKQDVHRSNSEQKSFFSNQKSILSMETCFIMNSHPRPGSRARNKHWQGRNRVHSFHKSNSDQIVDLKPRFSQGIDVRSSRET